MIVIYDDTTYIHIYPIVVPTAITFTLGYLCILIFTKTTISPAVT